MEHEKRTTTASTLLTIMIWGGAWGIFEATAGYLLHFLPFRIGWLVWYPVACFFLFQIYRQTQCKASIVGGGILSAGIKLLNLLLPGSPDRVLNPAVSIVLEALMMAAAILLLHRLSQQRRQSPAVKGLAVISMNTGWRILYVVYLLFLVPDWMREVSVIRNAESFITFFLLHNLGTSVLLFIGALLSKNIGRFIKTLQTGLTRSFSGLSPQRAGALKAVAAIVLLGGSIALEFTL